MPNKKELKIFEISVINLKEDEGKREEFSKSFPDINFKFIEAINGKNLSAIDYYKYTQKTIGRAAKKNISPSEVGCFLSHKKAIENFLNSDKEYLLIFEDDVKRKKELFFIEKIDISQDRIFILGGQNGLRRPKIFQPFLKNERPIKIPSIFNGFIYRTCCYAMNKNVAKKLSLAYSNFVFLADDWASIIKKSKIEGISYIEIFDHPLDLQSSSIEAERKMKK